VAEGNSERPLEADVAGDIPKAPVEVVRSGARGIGGEELGGG
jgi:hypothetical protein